MGQGKVMTAVTIALTYAYTWTISAQNTNLQPINDLVEVFGLCLERGLGVELLGNRRVGLGVDLRLLELLGHVESGNCCERSESSSGEGRLDVCRFNTSLDRDARSEGCENTSGREHAWIRGKKVLAGVLLYFWILELLLLLSPLNYLPMLDVTFPAVHHRWRSVCEPDPSRRSSHGDAMVKS